MRYFLAIPLPEEIKQKLHNINKKLQHHKSLRFVNPDNMHLTLLFLGKNDVREKIKDLKKISFEPFQLKTKNIDLFPENKKARLLWVNLKKSSELNNLQKKIAKAFNIDKKYNPHITLARIKRIDQDQKEKVSKEIKNLKTPEITINVKNFKLYSSELTVLGPVHRVIEYFEATKEQK